MHLENIKQFVEYKAIYFLHATTLAFCFYVEEAQITLEVLKFLLKFLLSLIKMIDHPLGDLLLSCPEIRHKGGIMNPSISFMYLLMMFRESLVGQLLSAD